MHCNLSLELFVQFFAVQKKKPSRVICDIVTQMVTIYSLNVKICHINVYANKTTIFSFNKMFDLFLHRRSLKIKKSKKNTFSQ